MGKDVENAVKIIASKVDELISSSALVKADDFLKVGNEKFIVRQVPHGIFVIEGFLEIFKSSTERIFVFCSALVDGFSEGEIDHRNISRDKQLLHLIYLSPKACSFFALFRALFNQFTHSKLYLRE